MFQPAGIFLNHASPLGFNGFLPTRVSSLYEFPNPSKGKKPGASQRIAIIELGGIFDQTELDTYFSLNNLGKAPRPKIVIVDNAPTTSSPETDIEVALDVQIIASICTGAIITLYFARNTFEGFYKAIELAGKTNDCISISWGADERDIDIDTLAAYEKLIGSIQKPIFISSGDNGSRATNGPGNSVSFPASCPSAISCGGTTLVENSGKIISEKAWGGSGGGCSSFFPRPVWQKGSVSFSMRGVPDICGNADPATGFRIYTKKTGHFVVGGTSAVAPLMACLAALLNQNRTPKTPVLTLIQPSLYSFVTRFCFRDVTKGSNGAYTASRGWDPVTGLGVPIGRLLKSEFFVGFSNGEKKQTMVQQTPPNNLKKSENLNNLATLPLYNPPLGQLGTSPCTTPSADFNQIPENYRSPSPSMPALSYFIDSLPKITDLNDKELDFQRKVFPPEFSPSEIEIEMEIEKEKEKEIEIEIEKEIEKELPTMEIQIQKFPQVILPVFPEVFIPVFPEVFSQAFPQDIEIEKIQLPRTDIPIQTFPPVFQPEIEIEKEIEIEIESIPVIKARTAAISRRTAPMGSGTFIRLPRHMYHDRFTPRVTSIYPSRISKTSRGSRIALLGSNLANISDATIQGVVAKVVFTSQTVLKIMVPDNLRVGEAEIVLSNGNVLQQKVIILK